MITNIYTYENDNSLNWNDQQTYLCVYDKNNVQIADYDFDTGLRLMLKDNKIHVYINNSDLVSGKWKFFGNLGGKLITSSGDSKSKNNVRSYQDLDPWRFDHRPGTYLNVIERKERISICRVCPMFSKDGICEINGMLAIERTKMKIGICPEGKWGNAEEAQETYESEYVVGEIGPDRSIQEQIDFESQFDVFLKGL